MVKNGKTPAGRHEHCDTCYDARCKAPAQSSVSCSVVKCPKSCGFTFHLCKREEHQLLCPNETVPCINVVYGCPLVMLRRGRAKHLEVCPASVVCCSQEWNRWPVSEKDLTFSKNVSEACQAAPHLDVAAALRDQDVLFRSIKMKNVFPELMKKEQPERVSEEEKTARAETEENEAIQEERACASVSVQDYAAPWEKIFRKEMGGCKETVKNMTTKEGKGIRREDQGTANCQEARGSLQLNQASSADGATGLAPWQDGVLERLGREVNIAEYNMYLVHHGAMLIDFGQLAACTPREKDFVYGNLEPIEVQTVRTFNVPTSYRAKRVFLKDPARKAKTEHKSVDTGDLDVSVEALPKSDEVSAALLCSLEKEFKGHLISESASVDGFYIDVGTQTYDFSSAPFEPDASLADVVADRPRRLHMRTEAESVTRRHNRASSAFSYMCGHFFRRDEYRSHFRNVHSDIRASLSGWLQQRCPLAYLGCTFTQTRLQPASRHPASVKFRPDAGTFVLLPHVPQALCEGREALSPRGKGARDPDPLSALPVEILQHVAAYLDSFTLSQLSQVSHLMRDLCATLLQERGMVSLKWKKKTYSHGGSSWKCRKKVWEFSSLFSPVDRWSLGDAPSMSEHLKRCSFYQREERTEPVVLPCLGEVRDKHGGSEA